MQKDIENQPAKSIKFIINPSEITAGTRGASMGPYALMTAARNKGSYIFGDHPVEVIADVNHLLDRPSEDKFAKNIDGLIEVFKNVSNSISETLMAGKFPFVLAADHGSAGGTIAGIKKAFPNKRLGVIWIDAHGDLHSPYTTPSGNMHGMPLSTALNEDNLPCKSNDIPKDTADKWNALKNLNAIAPKVLPQDLIFIGVRDTEFQEDALIERLKIKNFKVAEVNTKGAEIIASETLNLLADCDMIYISFDVDSMDPEVTSHGTGTPVAAGLLPSEVEEMMLNLIKSPKLVCIEFVEINPCLDEKTNKMAEVAFDILQPIIENLKAQ